MNPLELLEMVPKGGRVGLDVGSRSTKIAVSGENGPLTGMGDTIEIMYGGVLEGIPPDIDVVSTGYGRNKVKGGRKIPEIRAHTVGALKSIDIDTFTLLDIGGQDFKVVRVERGSIKDFHMNDKCAAGTGRFLEKMAEMLHLTIEELGTYRGDSKILESTCSVFTERELISLLMEGASRDRLAGGVVYSVYERVRPYLRMFPSDIIVFTGGVSRCAGLTGTIEDDLGTRVVIPGNSQFMGALGCYHAVLR